MRDPKQILNDICQAFDVDIDAYQNRGPKKVTDRMSLVTQAYVYVMLHLSLLNRTELGKSINRSAATITLMYQKAEILLACKHPYAEDFKYRVAKSCTEAANILEQYHHYTLQETL